MAETSTAGELSLEETAARAKAILDEIERAVIGKRPVLELVLAGLLADGHLLLDDLPGVAKTLTARSLATVTGLAFHRIQFTPDLLPADLIGTMVFDQKTQEFHVKKGPLFAQIILADEINRAPAKVQAALLEAMQEHQVTIGGTTFPLDEPFMVLATQNPIEQEGTYPLPEAQLDRFMLKVRVGYPSRDEEKEVLLRRLRRGTDEVALTPVATAADVLAMQRALERVHVAEPVGRYAVAIVTATRDEPQLQVGASPRGSLALVKLARAHALLQGRDFVTPDDVKEMARPALAHRLVLRSELWVRRVAAEDVLAGVLDGVPAPTWH
jgi:MoxR-like ATPase